MHEREGIVDVRRSSQNWDSVKNIRAQKRYRNDRKKIMSSLDCPSIYVVFKIIIILKVNYYLLQI